MKDWHKADIKAALEKAGWSLRRLSAHHGYATNSIRVALDRPYMKAEQLIAQAIGVPAETIWPSRYLKPRPYLGPGGAPTHKTGRNARKKYNTHPGGESNGKN